MGIGEAVGGLFGFGSDDDDIDEAQRQQTALMNQQIEESKAELSRKRSDIYNRALNIKKSQGGEIWKANRDVGGQGVKNNNNTGNIDNLINSFPSGLRPRIKDDLEKHGNKSA